MGTPENQAWRLQTDTPLPESPLTSPPPLSPQVTGNLAVGAYYDSASGLAEILFDRDPRSVVERPQFSQTLPNPSCIDDRETQTVLPHINPSFWGIV